MWSSFNFSLNYELWEVFHFLHAIWHDTLCICDQISFLLINKFYNTFIDLIVSLGGFSNHEIKEYHCQNNDHYEPKYPKNNDIFLFVYELDAVNDSKVSHWYSEHLNDICIKQWNFSVREVWCIRTKIVYVILTVKDHAEWAIMFYVACSQDTKHRSEEYQK